jgi:mycofactocin system glycosyltransferase
MSVPLGLVARVRADVERRERGRLLVGGSPMRAVRLSLRAADLLASDTLTVTDEQSWQLARRLLDGNVADLVPGAPVEASELTVVIPVRDRPEQLDRCLAALGGGPRVIVVDDASEQPGRTRALARRHGAEWVGLPVNRGPAAARNAGLAEVTTPYVAFVDSDITVSATTLRALAGHFVDPRVALVGPMVRGRARGPRPRWFERYDAAASSLTLGRRPCSVRPGAAVAWLPSATLVGRTDVLAEHGGFADALRVGEDVDLVWRLVAAGHVVRYDPARQAHHDTRRTITGWLGRKVVYGSGGAVLAARHGDAVAPAVLPALMIGASVLPFARPRWLRALALAPVVWAGLSVHRTLPETPGRGGLAARLTLRGAGWTLRQESALLLRHWWPATLAGAVVSRRVRRAVMGALVVDAAVAIVIERPRVDPVTGWVGRRLDDLAYGAGLWLGALRARDLRCLAIRVTR